MSQRKNLAVAAALILTVFCVVSSANAQNQPCPYTVESLNGAYAVVNSYGASVAMGLQVEYLDGNGNLTRTGVLNQPVAGSTTGERTVVPVTSVGTYTVRCDGTGTITRIVTKPDGSKAEAFDDFIITDATREGWRFVVNTFVDAQRIPSVILPGGVFVTRVHTRRPELHVEP